MIEDTSETQIAYCPDDSNRRALMELVGQDPKLASLRLSEMLLGYLPNPHHEDAKVGMIPEPYELLIRVLPDDVEQRTLVVASITQHLASVIHDHIPKRRRLWYKNRLIYNALSLATALPTPEVLYQPLLGLTVKGDLIGDYFGIPNQYMLEQAILANTPQNN